LDHEPVDDAMEGEAVVEAGLRQIDKIGDMIGSHVGQEGEVHVAEIGVDGNLFHGNLRWVQE
jgi:hypothetical protein